MEETNQVESSVSENESTVSPSDTAAPASEAQSTPDAASAAPVIPAAYTPDYKFSAYGKEYEIPEQLRAAIKDAETEKMLKSLHSKAYGFDGIQGKYQKAQERVSSFEKTINEEFQPLRTHFDSLNKYIKNKDYDTLFATAGIPEADLQQWMLRKLQAQSLPPDQQAVYQKEAEQRKQLYELEAKNQSYESRLAEVQEAQMQQAVQQRTSELESALNQPDTKAVAEAYEARTGQSFRDVVIKIAQAEHKTTGKDLSVAEAVQSVMSMIGPVQNTQAPAANQAAQGKPPIIPNVVGKSTSPTQPRIKSLDDLKKYAQSVAMGNSGA